ncbi:MAG: HemK/PrmC family methyltransferase, partial [Anaerovorax sp.]
VLAVDVSDKALEVAKQNAMKNRVQNSMKFLQSDMFSQLKTGHFGQKFDVIVSNPPYIPTRHIPILQREVKEHEPLLALDGGEDGLDFYRKIAENGGKFLKKKGTLYLEIGYDQGEDVAELLGKEGNYSDIELIKDLAGLDRVVKCKKVLD